MRTTWSDRRPIRLCSSAIAMKRSGAMIPVSGCSHRASTSNPMIAPVRRSTCGSKKGTNWSCSSPKRMPCSISLCAISSRSIPASNHIGRAERALRAWSIAMSARRSRSGMLMPCGLADDMPRKAPTWINLPCSSSGSVTARSSRSASRERFAAVVDRAPATANSPPLSRASAAARRALRRQRRRQAAQHRVADVIAVAVVDRLEAVELDRQDRDLRAARRGRGGSARPGRRTPCG